MLAEALKAITTFRGQPPDGYRYSCFEDFVLRRGTVFESRDVDRQAVIKLLPLMRFEPRQCFYNAQMAAIRNPDLVYVEGYVLRIIPILHAWLSCDGAVVDLTLRTGKRGRGKLADRVWGDLDGVEYIGVQFPDSAMIRRRILSTGYSSSLIDDWHNDFPAMRGVYDEEETTVPVRGHADDGHDRCSGGRGAGA